jgi:hypothetical protein
MNTRIGQQKYLAEPTFITDGQLGNITALLMLSVCIES